MSGTQFACFTSAKVQILTPEELSRGVVLTFDVSICTSILRSLSGTHFTCFTSTKVQIRTPEELS